MRNGVPEVHETAGTTMDRFSLITVLKYLVGILLAQGAAVVMAIAAYEARLMEHWGVLALFALLVGGFAALWFAAIANGTRHHALARVREDFAREREQIRVRSEQDKSKLVAQTHRDTIKTIRRVQAGASFKLGAGFAALVGLGGVMLLAQFVTVGLLTLSVAGGGLLGYAVRVRQEYLGRKRATAELADERTVRRSGPPAFIEGRTVPVPLDELVEKHLPTARI